MDTKHVRENKNKLEEIRLTKREKWLAISVQILVIIAGLLIAAEGIEDLIARLLGIQKSIPVAIMFCVAGVCTAAAGLYVAALLSQGSHSDESVREWMKLFGRNGSGGKPPTVH